MLTYQLYDFIGGGVLYIKYEDGTECYKTEDFKSMLNFVRVVNPTERTGNMTHNQLSKWYNLDLLEGLI